MQPPLPFGCFRRARTTQALTVAVRAKHKTPRARISRRRSRPPPSPPSTAGGSRGSTDFDATTPPTAASPASRNRGQPRSSAGRPAGTTSTETGSAGSRALPPWPRRTAPSQQPRVAGRPHFSACANRKVSQRAACSPVCLFFLGRGSHLGEKGRGGGKR